MHTAADRLCRVVCTFIAGLIDTCSKGSVADSMQLISKDVKHRHEWRKRQTHISVQEQKRAMDLQVYENCSLNSSV